ncbi:MAG: DUF350 domain-containing protein [candidate division NC10 bacterium]|nr:DUF350 domain-containing protein [candidate division NC10 bacterium]
MLVQAGQAFGQQALPTPPLARGAAWGNLVISLVYGVVGMLLLIGGYYFYELVTPYSLRKELVEDQNIALGIVVAAIILGMAIIIAAAIV